VSEYNHLIAAARHAREMVLSLREPSPPMLPLPVIGVDELILRNRLGEKMVTLKGNYRLDNLVRELSEVIKSCQPPSKG